MSGKPETDPYYSLRDTVQDEIERIQTNHKRFQSLLRTDTSGSNEFRDLRKGLTGEVKKVDGELTALKSMLDMIDKNRGNYGYIKDSELDNRKKFVSNNMNVLKNVRESLNSEEVRKKIEEDKQKASRNPMQGMDEAQREKQRQLDNENSRFLGNQQDVVKRQINEQDRNLDLLGGAIDNVHVKAKLINEEISEQNKMINKLGDDVDTAKDKMDVVTAALAKLLKTKDTCQIWTIIILGLVLILLVCLVIWT